MADDLVKDALVQLGVKGLAAGIQMILELFAGSRDAITRQELLEAARAAAADVHGRIQQQAASPAEAPEAVG